MNAENVLLSNNFWGNFIIFWVLGQFYFSLITRSLKIINIELFIIFLFIKYRKFISMTFIPVSTLVKVKVKAFNFKIQPLP